MIKKVTHIYFGDHRYHPIILNYLNDSEIKVKILDAPKSLGSRFKRLGKLIYQLRILEKADRRNLHAHDILSFYISRFFYPMTNVIFDSHEVYSSYFRFPVSYIVRFLEEIATLISTKKIFPSHERRDLYIFKSNTEIIENLFYPIKSEKKTNSIARDFKSFVYAGLLSEHRCISELVCIFNKMPALTLSIYGEKNEYMNQIIESGLPENVRYFGQVSHEIFKKELPKYAASFALYRPINLNNKYPTPTKIFENEYSGIATIVLNSNYLDRLCNDGRLINTFFLNEITVSSLQEILDSRCLGDCKPNISYDILWESQKSVIENLYDF
tara:strand:- start:3122 stop:4102 length:981 start_codon:yes stop_codon:yes gene_type:complete